MQVVGRAHAAQEHGEDLVVVGAPLDDGRGDVVAAARAVQDMRRPLVRGVPRRYLERYLKEYKLKFSVKVSGLSV